MKGLLVGSLAWLFGHAALASDWYIEKQLSVSASSRASGTRKLTSQVNTIGLNMEYQNQAIELKIDGQWQYDSVYDWSDAYSEDARNSYRSRFWLDEGFISWSWSAVDLFLGYQKVVWGQADDLRVVDVVNPLDLKDFVLFDIDEYRISLPMLRMVQSFRDWDIEVLWIVASEPNKLPSVGSEFAIPLLENIPESEPSGSEFGLKAQTFVLGTDLSFYAFHGYNDTPVLSFESREPETDSRPLLKYGKDTMLGSSLSRPLGDWVVRGEAAFFLDREFTTLDFHSPDSHVIKYLIGLDYLYRNWLLTAQVTDHDIRSWNSNYLTEKHEPLYTVSADGTLASGTVALRFAASHADYAGGGQLYQSKLSYLPNQNWAFRFHLDLLSGAATNFFGQFDQNDRIWLSVSYTF